MCSIGHIPFIETPIERLDYLSQKTGSDILCKRDDLFAAAGGGNKARMLHYILNEINTDNCDVLITAGPTTSNFNRACALLCSKLGLKMHLVEYGEETSINHNICQLCGIIITPCSKSEVKETIAKIVDSYKDRRVKVIYGGGRSLEGIFSYYEAISYLSTQINDINSIFLACGTGTTLAGICAGAQDYFPMTKIHAISVSRKWEDEKKVLEEDLSWLGDFRGRNYDLSNVIFHEEFLCGGYNCFSQNISKVIKECISNEGLVTDPCYTGKAIYGMLNILKQDNISRNGRTLFWHTGGNYNFLSNINDLI